MPIMFDRDTCRDLHKTISQEWLITNGLGGYAAGTVAGALTRLQHGLLVTTLPGSKSPYLLLAKIDEEVAFDQRTYYLGTNEYKDGMFNPSGFVHMETFRLEEGFPIFTYHIGGLNGFVLEKRIWMPWGQNTTCIQYRLLPRTEDQNRRRSTRADGLALTLLPLTTYRPHNTTLHGDNTRHFQVQLQRGDNVNSANPVVSPGITGCTIQAGPSAHPYHILAVSHPHNQATFLPTGVWYWNFLRRMDSTPGQPTTDDLYLPGVIRATLQPGEDKALTIVASTEQLSTPALQPEQLTRSYISTTERQQRLFRCVQGHSPDNKRSSTTPRILPLTTTTDPQAGGEDYLRLLLLASDCFLARPAQFEQHDGLSSRNNPALLYTSYYALVPSTRDALIALPGLTLVTRRYETALSLLQTLSRAFHSGLLPDRLPRPGETNTYTGADTTLWFFYALDYYLRATHHYTFLEEHFHSFEEALDAYIHGTTPGIFLDQKDGLLRADQPGQALTWMNATINGTPITPRSGKPVELNALWYHALSLMCEWAGYLHRLGHSVHTTPYYLALLKQCEKSFQQRFWYSKGGYLYDVVDGPEGDDAALRPNQLLALSLRYPVLAIPYRRHTFECITHQLLTPYGLRTLSPTDPAYHDEPGSCEKEQQKALHQGSAWPWLLGPYIDAMLTIDDHSEKQELTSQDLLREYLWRRGLRLLEPLKEHLYRDLLGMCPATVGGSTPHQPGYVAASSLSIAELLRIYDVLAHIRTTQPERSLSH
ncbi:MAG: glycogen debranching enzyme N-terminal domain-containing protein [Ktedonobacteraceae bacterium]|nr:glycogen debranching enzyme N-terminal domain-containing protein [Ktedonobacteraceae bacterium]